MQALGSGQGRHPRRLPGDARPGPYPRQDRIGRVQLCRCMVERAVPAHAQRLAGAGPGAADGQGDDRWRRTRPLHPRPRLVLDRPAALQRAVRRAAVLRDQERRDRRHGRGRRLPDPHAGILERLLGDLRRTRLPSRRLVLRRQGPAQPGFGGVARFGDDALRRHQHHQYGAQPLSRRAHATRAPVHGWAMTPSDTSLPGIGARSDRASSPDCMLPRSDIHHIVLCRKSLDAPHASRQESGWPRWMRCHPSQSRPRRAPLRTRSSESSLA
ncbi:hypothetical protein LUTEI9C_30107 [Luteimonas sp. 9C]|nr:hypothetical protein LUTEI9C_30107 [Luteimonas sp. 9C]